MLRFLATAVDWPQFREISVENEAAGDPYAVRQIALPELLAQRRAYGLAIDRTRKLLYVGAGQDECDVVVCRYEDMPFTVSDARRLPLTERIGTVHQLDIFRDLLLVPDTSGDRVIVADRFSGATVRILRLPDGHPYYFHGGSYSHYNSVWVDEATERVYVVAHNQSRRDGRPSFLVIFDLKSGAALEVRERGQCCHNAFVWHGQDVWCSSQNGEVRVGDACYTTSGYPVGLAATDHDIYTIVNEPEPARHKAWPWVTCYLQALFAGWRIPNLGTMCEVRLLAPGNDRDYARSDAA